MKNICNIIIALLLLAGCESEESGDQKANFRIVGFQYTLEFTHKSHYGQVSVTPRNAFAPTISFELFLSEETNYQEIPTLRIADTLGTGWEFDNAEIVEAYREEQNSLVFQSLDLDDFDVLRDKLIRAQFLDESGEVIRGLGFTLDNDFPLPALTSSSRTEDAELRIFIDFYETPYDGGQIPFAVRIYNTYYDSNFFSVTWLDDSRRPIRANTYSLDQMSEYEFNDWRLDVPLADIPSNAVYFYTTFRRNGFSRSGALFTEIDQIAAN